MKMNYTKAIEDFYETLPPASREKFKKYFEEEGGLL